MRINIFKLDEIVMIIENFSENCFNKRSQARNGNFFKLQKFSVDNKTNLNRAILACELQELNFYVPRSRNCENKNSTTLILKRYIKTCAK